MDKKRIKNISLLIGISGGLVSDVLVRLLTGEEGNLLIHSVIFIAGATFFSIASYLIMRHLKK